MSDIIEGLALVAFVAAGWLVAPALGLAVAGAALLLVAAAIEGTQRAAAAANTTGDATGPRPPHRRGQRVRVPSVRIPRPRIRRPGATAGES